MSVRSEMEPETRRHAFESDLETFFTPFRFLNCFFFFVFVFSFLNVLAVFFLRFFYSFLPIALTLLIREPHTFQLHPRIFSAA